MIPNKTLDTLRDRGLRLTRPRRIILDVVRATDAHPTAALVYRRVRRRLPRVSLATVYRNLRMLAAEGFLAERADVPVRAERSGRRRPSARAGFEVLDHRTEYYGRCAACPRTGGRSSPTRQRRNHGRPQGH
jgi:Fe2+ or Zn2+ uptake regulation protein